MAFWNTADDIEKDLMEYDEFAETNGSDYKPKPAPPKSIAEFRARMTLVNNPGIYETNRDDVTTFICGRGKYQKDRCVRPGEPVESVPLDDISVRRKLREVAGLGYSNELIERSLRIPSEEGFEMPMPNLKISSSNGTSANSRSSTPSINSSANRFPSPVNLTTTKKTTPTEKRKIICPDETPTSIPRTRSPSNLSSVSTDLISSKETTSAISSAASSPLLSSRPESPGQQSSSSCSVFESILKNGTYTEFVPFSAAENNNSGPGQRDRKLPVSDQPKLTISGTFAFLENKNPGPGPPNGKIFGNGTDRLGSRSSNGLSRYIKDTPSSSEDFAYVDPTSSSGSEGDYVVTVGNGPIMKNVRPIENNWRNSNNRRVERVDDWRLQSTSRQVNITSISDFPPLQ